MIFSKKIDLQNFEYLDPAETDINILSVILIIVLCIILFTITEKIYKKYKEREKQKKIIKKKKYKYDPEMFSNEPLNLEKCKNLKYKGYIEAQYEELKKHHYF